MASAEPWRRHTIDGSSRGADGVRLADINRDGLPDLVTGWEEGGQIRCYLHPGATRAASPWPAVTVGQVRSPEDAVLVDVDGDGALDVVSCCESRTRTVYVHWAPARSSAYLDARQWVSQAIPATQGQQMWMFALPMQVDGQHGLDLIVGSKGSGASIGWLRTAADARAVEQWHYHRLYDAGWIMSLASVDMDGDGDLDVLASDRKGDSRGVLWLANPGVAAVASAQPWTEHRIGGQQHEVMFLDLADLDHDTVLEIIVATRNGEVLIFRRQAGQPQFEQLTVANAAVMPHGKAVRCGDIDGDGQLDLVLSAERGPDRSLRGVMWTPLERPLRDQAGQWQDISGPDGSKFDLVQLLDVDQDGDLDVITCEERDNLGIFWYENEGLGIRD